MKRKRIIFYLLVSAFLAAVCISCKDKIAITDIKLNKDQLSLSINGTGTLKANLLPTDASDKMSWSSSNNNVATVKGGGGTVTISEATVTGKSAGTAIITVSTKDGKHKAQCTVTVINPEPEMVSVEGGTFDMGCTDGDCYSDGREEPAHKVTLSKFNIAKYTVTQQQWEAIMGSNPSYNKGCDLPVERVSWNDVQVFIQKLNTFSGKKYRLPTEAEWEYAARGGNKSMKYKYSGSNDINAVAWYSANSGQKTHFVGTKAPNELGIYDMSGNISEWCSDWYGSYTNAAQTNPTGPSSGTMRVARGGNALSYETYSRVSFRISGLPGNFGDVVGFRLVHPVE